MGPPIYRDFNNYWAIIARQVYVGVLVGEIGLPSGETIFSSTPALEWRRFEVGADSG
eukprot:COSAG02_NODE_5244_length_4508_cov_42.946700_4_plen_57_part_00